MYLNIDVLRLGYQHIFFWGRFYIKYSLVNTRLICFLFGIMIRHGYIYGFKYSVSHGVSMINELGLDLMKCMCNFVLLIYALG